MGEGRESLSAEQLAMETETSVERISAMVDAGVLRPIGPDAFRPGDVQRVLAANAMDDAGLTLELLQRGIDLGFVSFEQTDVIYPDLGPRSPGSVADLAERLDLSLDTLLRIITAFGLPRPDPATHLHQPDESQLTAFVQAWRPLGDDELLVRAARIYGDALRRAAEGWMDLFEEVVVAPVAGRAIPWTEMRTLALEPGLPVLQVGLSMLPWLVNQHRGQALNRLNFEAIERMLALSDIPGVAPRRTAAILFADLAGYSRLTEERGDSVAADVATRLAVVADEIAQQHAGRLVKLLGDGVMLHFPRVADAVAAAVALRDAMGPADLPPAHTGIHAGAVIRRESDFFGRTVNVASRLAGRAGPNEILLTPEALEAAGDLPPGVGPAEDLGALELKGIPEPVAALRIGPG